MSEYRVDSNINGAIMLSDEKDHWIFRFDGLLSDPEIVYRESVDSSIIRVESLINASIIYRTDEYSLIRVEK